MLGLKNWLNKQSHPDCFELDIAPRNTGRNSSDASPGHGGHPVTQNPGNKTQINVALDNVSLSLPTGYAGQLNPISQKKISF